MTTDNRTNVQIVADALRSMPEAERDDDRDPAVVVAEYAVAALVAAQGAAPVLPSSGVDEEKLAEVIATATYDWSHQRLEFWRKPKNVEPPGDLDTFIARAVAEWLKGQER